MASISVGEYHVGPFAGAEASTAACAARGTDEPVTISRHSSSFATSGDCAPIAVGCSRSPYAMACALTEQSALVHPASQRQPPWVWQPPWPEQSLRHSWAEQSRPA